MSKTTKCLRCGGRLTPVGSRRVGGANHEDWDEREFHKGCWKGLAEEDKEFYYDNRRVYVTVPYGRREQAKAAGLRWDPEERCWYARDQFHFAEQQFPARYAYDEWWFIKGLSGCAENNAEDATFAELGKK